MPRTRREPRRAAMPAMPTRKSGGHTHALRDGARRLAALDVGTNSIRLIVAEAHPDGSYRLIDDEKDVTRLGQGMSRTGALNGKAMNAAAESIARMKDIAAGYGVTALRAVATCAVRGARNRAQFLKLVKNRAGLDLQVISAQDEARLAYMSVKHAFDLRGINAAIVDIGGGSTEVVLCSSGVIEQVHALPLGAVGLTEQFHPDGRPSAETLAQLASHVRKTVKQHVGRPSLAPQVLIGTGGTFTALAAVAMTRERTGQESDGSPNVRGYEMQRAAVNHLLSWLASLSPKARARVPGLSPDRADIIVAGVTIIDELMRCLKVNTLRVHDRGLRDGLILSMIRQIFPKAGLLEAGPLDRMRAVRRFAQACRYEQSHSEHVAALAMQAYDQLTARMPPGAWSRPPNRELLHAAAVLHDVGYSINYAKHHKHSYHIIVHNDLPGFTHRELEIIANVARYHRRSTPKNSHVNFAKLSAPDQDLVMKLSAILRLVDGLDRTHAQTVRSVRVQVRKGTAWFIATAPTEPAVDMWGAARKSGLFLKAFGLEPRFDWRGGSGKSSAAQLLRHAVEPAVLTE